MHELFLLIIIVIVAIVIIQQCHSYRALRKVFGIYEKYLEGGEESYTRYSWDQDGVQMVAIAGMAGSTGVIRDINDYLVANAGVAPNFEIVKDIVERGSNSLDERIRTLLPIPLYYGLCGTIFGIILGLIPLIGSRQDLLSALSPLLAGVALAMVGSAVGIVLTTWGNATYKDKLHRHEEDKNEFFSWFQREMLPVMGADSSGPLGQLLRSLTEFNDSFRSSANTMSSTSQSIVETFAKQERLLVLLEELKGEELSIRQVELVRELQDNVEVVRRLNNSIVGMDAYVGKLQQISSQLASSTEYLEVVRSLSSTLSSSEGVLSNSAKALEGYVKRISNLQQELMSKTLEDVKEQNTKVVDGFRGVMEETMVDFQRKLEQHTSLPDSLVEMSRLPKVLERLSQTLEGMQQSQVEMGNQLERIGQRIEKLERSAARPERVKPSPKPKPLQTPEPPQTSPLPEEAVQEVMPGSELLAPMQEEPEAEKVQEKRPSMMKRIISLFQKKSK